MKSCLVLVATYNGEKYLQEQLDSILAQKGVEIFIKVSDDCSTDGTQKILKSYKENYSNFDYSVNEKNKRFTYNFLDLFFSINENIYDYYAFCDQDDFWLPEKIAKAIEQIENTLKNNKNGVLYCSNLIVANEKLERIGMQEDESIYKCHKNNFFFENIATGCTIVFNTKFKIHAQKYYPIGISLHDYWLFLIAAYTATYVYDINGYILYRQHETNQIGSNKTKWTWKNIKYFFRYRGPQSKLVEQLLIGYGKEIAEKDRQSLLYMRDYKRKLSYKNKLMYNKKFKKRSHNLIKGIRLLFNKY